MNFLAHLAIAYITHTSPSANLLADYFKGPVPDDYPDFIQAGIYMHRFVDSYAHQNKIIQQSISKIDKSYRLVSSILMDLFFDHFLAYSWRFYFPNISLDLFLSIQYRMLEKEKEIYPHEVLKFLNKFLQKKWIEQYSDPDGMIDITQQLSFQKDYLSLLYDGALELKKHYSFFRQQAELFFPNLFMDSILFSSNIPRLLKK